MKRIPIFETSTKKKMTFCDRIIVEIDGLLFFFEKNPFETSKTRSASTTAHIRWNDVLKITR